MQEFERVISETNGRFFTVTFTKKDGSIRVMNCRTGVKKYLKGGKRTVGNNCIVVYDIQSAGYRAIRKDSILSVTFEHLNLSKIGV